MNNNNVYSHSKRRTKKRKLISKIASVSCVLIILVGVVATISFAGVFNNNNNTDTPANTENSVIAPEISTSENIDDESSVTYESSVVSEPQKPVYSSNAKFTVNNSRFSDTVKSALDEQITSEFVLLYDITEDEIIYQKNADRKCYPASTTKMLTSIVASSIIDPDTVITVGDEIELIGEESSTAGLQIGDKLTFEMLIDALMLPSGNDAAYTVAVNTARIFKNDQTLSNEEALSVFMDLVNDAARQIDASDTHFTTPDGWHDDDHYTTAIDLAKIANHLRTIPLLKNSVSKAYAKWEFISGGTAEWYNSNRLILNGSGQYSQYVDGIKTGFTDEAGTSVVASATINGHSMIAVIMNAQSLYEKYNEANILFKAGFDIYDLEYTYE